VHTFLDNIRTAMFLSAILALTACAAKSQFVDLTYPPEDNPDNAASAGTGQSAAVPHDCSLELQAIDEREDKARIGTSPFRRIGQSESFVYTDDNVALWVQDAVAHELGLLGYSVVDGHLASDDVAVDDLKIAVTRIEANCFESCTVEISLVATLSRLDTEVLRAEVNGRNRFFPWGRKPETALRKALPSVLQESIHTMFQDLGIVGGGNCKGP
jgi:hypothetical protein